MIGFKLSDEFVNSYKDKEVKWGYKDGAGNALGEITFLRTYSRKKEDGTKEQWYETCRRVIEGMFTIQKRHCRQNHIEWKNDKAQRTAKDAYDRLFNMKWLPSGRGLWAMGSELVMEEGNSAPLQSCAFISTDDSIVDAMTFLFDASMLGVGVGFDADGADKFDVTQPVKEGTFVIPDSREGWVESLRILLASYLDNGKTKLPEFDYSEIRPAGAPIKRFGGVASGSGPLRKMHTQIEAILANRVGEKATMTDIADIGNIIGTCVVAGNVRRSAEIFFVDRDSDSLYEFLHLKDYEKNPERGAWGYMCLPEDSWIHTNNGPKRLRDLVGSNFSAALGGKSYPSESSGFFLTSEDREVFTVSTKQGYSVRATSNHPIKTKNGFVNVEDLKAGDKILVANHTNPDWEGSGGTFSEGYLVGAVWGDGTYTLDSKDRNRYRASILLYDGGADAEYIKYVEKQAQEIHPNAKFGKATKSGVLQMRNNNITSLVEGYGFACGKRVTDEIESSSVDFYRGFLRAAFDADGTVAKYRAGVTGGQVILSQSSFSDLQAIQRMLGRLGIYSTIRQASMSEWGKKDPFTLAVSARSLQIFYDLVGFAHSDKAAKLKKIMETKKKTYSQNAPFYAEVTDISLSSVEAVYDVTISEVHEFDANGIVVHNSNNSVRVSVGDDLTPLMDGIKLNGEPGVVWMDVIRNYGRIIDGPDYNDLRVRGLNPCFPADTLLATEEGWTTFGEAYRSGEAQNILVDGRVTFEESTPGEESPEDWKIDLSKKYDPQIMQASHVFLTNRDAPIVKVSLSNGIDLRCTPDHLIATKDGMVRADELTPEHKVLITRGFTPTDGLPNLTVRENIDGFLMGLVAGDGYIDSGKLTEKVYVDLWGDDREIVPTVIGWIDDLFDQFKDKYVSHSNRQFTAHNVEHREDRDQIRIKSSFLAAYLNGEYGFNKASKHVVPSKFISQSTSSAARAYVAGLAFADGTVNKYNKVGSSSIRIGQANKSFLQDVQRILLSNGIFSSVYSRSKAGPREMKGKPCIRNEFFELVVMMNTYEYTNHVGFGFGHKQALAQQLFTKRSQKQATYSTVVSVVDDGVEDVYCLRENTRRILSANGVTARRCSEQPLESSETCNLVEVFINNCDDQDDFIKTLKVAYLYGKTVTLMPTKWEKTNTVMQRNRRIGLSASGVADFVDAHGMAKLRSVLDDGFNYVLKLDKKYSEWLCIRESIRHTTMKPSGSISILAGSSPGTHWTPGGEYFIRRITFAKSDPLFQRLLDAGYEHETLDHDPNSAVILFPIHSKSKRASSDVPAWEKIHLASEIQAWWSDNGVSCTVDFKPSEAEDIPTLLAMYDGKLKGISFLPAIEGGAYKHMPYESISQDKFEEMKSSLRRAFFEVAYSDGKEAEGEKFCATDFCEIEEEVNTTEGIDVPIVDISSL